MLLLVLCAKVVLVHHWDTVRECRWSAEECGLLLHSEASARGADASGLVGDGDGMGGGRETDIAAAAAGRSC
mgnify:FL=1